MTTAEFHPRAVSGALACFVAQHDSASAEALVKGCNQDELRALMIACSELLDGVADALCHEVHHLVDHVLGGPLSESEREDYPDDGVLPQVITELACNVQFVHALLNQKPGEDDDQLAKQVAESFGRVVEHQLTEHPEGDHDDCSDDE